MDVEETYLYYYCEPISNSIIPLQVFFFLLIWSNLT